MCLLCVCVFLCCRDVYSELHVCDLLRQLLTGVDYLHGRRIVHLDLRSDNVLVTERNVLKIVDLGSAQAFTPGHALNVEHIKEMTESKGGTKRTLFTLSGFKLNVLFEPEQFV